MALVIPVAPPARRPRSGGIKSVTGDFLAETRLSAGEQIGWEASDCGDLSATSAGCFDTVTPEEKEFSGVSQFLGTGRPFARYAGVACFLDGDAEGPTYQAQAATILDQGEDREIEGVLWEWAADAVDPAEAASLTEAIAVADAHADANYAGLPILLMNRGDADRAKAEGALDFVDGKLVTANNTPVVASASVPAGSIAVVGWVAVYATDAKTFAAIDHRFNTEYALAERVYAIAVDCEYRYVVGLEA